MSKSVKAALIFIGLFILFAIFIYGLGGSLFPLAFSFGLAYLFFPFIKKLEVKGYSRNYTVPALFLILLLTFLLVLALIIPGLISDAQSFAKELPNYSNQAASKIENRLSSLGYEIDLNKENLSQLIKEQTSRINIKTLLSFTSGLQTSIGGFTKWVLSLLNLFLIPLFFFYVISDYEKILSEARSFLPKSLHRKTDHYLSLIDQALSGYIRGQLMVASCLSSLYALGLGFIGLKFGFLIGIITGLMSIIPYAGFSAGLFISLIVALANPSDGSTLIFSVLFVFVFIQILEGFILTPKLVGNKVGLSSFATMLALIIGGNLMGLFGMLIAIPVTSILKSVLVDVKAQYQNL